MSLTERFSFARLGAMVWKEFIQMRRDRLTFGMMIGIPMIQLVLFGFAINADPKHLPTAVLLADHGPQGRTLLQAMKNSSYFDFAKVIETEQAANDALSRGEVLFVVTIPEDFSRDLLRGERPVLLVEADATDPAATSNAIGSLRMVVDSALARDLQGPLASLAATTEPVELRIHAHYNPDATTQFNIVPGLMGVILTMTMVIITGLAITRERERGTMENLLSMPTRPLEVMLGKIIPYIAVGLLVHPGQPGGRHHVLDGRQESVAGDADVVLLLSAVDPAVGLYVSVPRYAGLGAGDRRVLATDALLADRAWHFAEGEWPTGDRGRVVGDCALHGRGALDRREALPANAGLASSVCCARLSHAANPSTPQWWPSPAAYRLQSAPPQ